MARSPSITHPARKLTEEGWEALRIRVATEREIKVEDLCAAAGVTKQRFYKRFPKGEKPMPAAVEQAEVVDASAPTRWVL